MRLISRKRQNGLGLGIILFLQVVNSGVKEALDEFVNTWVEERLQDILGAQSCPASHTLLETMGANLRLLIMNIMDLVSHFADFE